MTPGSGRPGATLEIVYGGRSESLPAFRGGSREDRDVFLKPGIRNDHQEEAAVLLPILHRVLSAVHVLRWDLRAVLEGPLVFRTLFEVLRFDDEHAATLQNIGEQRAFDLCVRIRKQRCGSKKARRSVWGGAGA
eukprot:CAMPEP_0180438922 /NCGR_PEP_ID=MMETSP1036_2-20121128/12319_1 /TAXON_ID=632150 /ORGANISM="Azadinium spinosum, Strain 3D9" /LENGTH=133 /DNA_ID=CAMNT_0022445039 /DNA_START=401 /DNA_END=804 /DNA_ORIENTATION=-